METQEVKILLQKYFSGESSSDEERALEKYFTSGKVAGELKEYSEFFGGISELADTASETGIEEDIMDYILEKEYSEKTRYRHLWKVVTGVAASVIVILGSFLIYEQQKPFKDTFSDPNQAYAYAEKTLEYISSKYNVGVAELSNTIKYNKGIAQLKKAEVFNKAPKPLAKGINAVEKGLTETQNISKYDQLTKNE